jgi:hypothetical protein
VIVGEGMTTLTRGVGCMLMDSCQLCGIYFCSCHLGNSIRGYECNYWVCPSSLLHNSRSILPIVVNMRISGGGPWMGRYPSPIALSMGRSGGGLYKMVNTSPHALPIVVMMKSKGLNPSPIILPVSPSLGISRGGSRR